MTFKIYDQCKVYYKSALLAEEASVSVQWRNNDSPVQTVVNGFSGVARGPEDMTISIESFVPAAGFEVDVTADMKDRTVVDIVLSCAGKILATQGYVQSCSLSSGVGNGAQNSFEMLCKFETWS